MYRYTRVAGAALEEMFITGERHSEVAAEEKKSVGEHLVL